LVINTIAENEEELSARPPVRIEILSPAENTPILDKRDCVISSEPS
jgi:hypothetical protein